MSKIDSQFTFHSTTNVVSKLLAPYLELMRFTKPAGTIYMYLPCLSSILLAGALSNPVLAPFELVGPALLCLVGSFVFRSAGCTWNDILDQNIDRKVARTKNRPLARGAISTTAAMVFHAAQVLLGMWLLLWFPRNCFYYLAPAMVLTAIYPLGKRFTDFPQVILGLTLPYGFIFGFQATGFDLDPLLLSTPLALNSISTARAAAAAMYFFGFTWTILYDAIYAFQDIIDDKRERVHSIAVRFESTPKALFSGLAVVQISALISAGLIISASPIYFLGVLGATISTACMIFKVDLGSCESCAWWFRYGSCWLIGGSVSLACFGEYCTRYALWL